MPLVSVLIPSYNHGPFLRACLDSVLSQTFTDWEVILTDDCSTDDSVAIARSFDDPRIGVFVNDHNLGSYGNLSRGMDRASGSLLAVLDSDDLWAPTKLEKQVALLEAHTECAFSYTLGKKVDAEGNAVEEDLHDDWPTDEVSDLRAFLLSENRILASSVVFRREGLSFDPSLRYSGDWVALIKASRRGKAACVAEDLTFWRMHGGNSFVRSQAQVNEEIRVRESILSLFDELLEKGFKDSLAQCAIHLSALYVLTGDMAGARKTAWQAVNLRKGTPSALKRFAVTMMPLLTARGRLWPGEEGIERTAPTSGLLDLSP